MIHFKRLPYLRPFFSDSLSTVPLLANHFLDIFRPEKGLQHLSISERAMEKMLEYEWPGNMRELRNALELAVVMGNGQEILPEDLPISAPKKSHPAVEVRLTLKETEDSFKEGVHHLKPEPFRRQ